MGTGGRLACVVALAVALSPTTAAPNQDRTAEQAAPPRLPGDQTLLDWLGWEAGQTLSYKDERHERYCVRIGTPRRLQDRTWAPLQGIPWPGLASDSQILLPLDGTLAFGVILTPGPRPFSQPLLRTGWGGLRFLESMTPDQALASALEDGWYSFGNSAGAPTTLVYVWCHGCPDEGTVLRMERERGIKHISSRTSRGTQRLHLVDDRCALPEVEFELYVDPGPGRNP